MKLVRKELAKIKLDACPNCVVAPRVESCILGAKAVKYSGEKLLVVTYYHAETREAYCRVYLSKDGYISYLYQKAEWTTKGVCSINAPSGGCTLDDSYRIKADEKSAKLVHAFTQGWSGNAAYNVSFYQSAIRRKKKRPSQEKARLTGEQAMQRALNERPPLPDDFEREVLDGPLQSSRYLFYRRDDFRDPLTGMREKRYVGYCTHCKAEHELWGAPEHKQYTQCPGCGSMVEARRRGVSRQGLVDKCSYAIQQRAGDAAYMRYFEVVRDYTGEPEQVHTDICETELFYFHAGQMWHFTRYLNWFGNRYRVSDWRVSRTKYESTNAYSLYPAPPEVWEGTCIAHSQFAQYLAVWTEKERYIRAMQYLALYLKHPGIEHLMQAGLYGIVHGKLRGDKDNGAVDWKQTRPRAMLGIPQAEIPLFAKNDNWGAQELAAYKRLKPLGATFDVESDGENLVDLLTARYIGFDDFEQTYGLAACVRYLRYQRRKRCGGQGSYIALFSQWRDYISFARELGHNMTLSEICFPPDLPAAHDKMAARIAEKRSADERRQAELTAEQWQAQYNALLPLAWEADGLIIRPVCTQAELTEEGDRLKHCVAGYGTRVREGETHIFLIRQADAPDTPYFTLNLSPEGKLIQCHGYKNDAEYKDRTRPEFIKQFERKWLTAKVKPWLAAKAREERRRKRAEGAGKKPPAKKKQGAA